MAEEAGLRLCRNLLCLHGRGRVLNLNRIHLGGHPLRLALIAFTGLLDRSTPQPVQQNGVRDALAVAIDSGHGAGGRGGLVELMHNEDRLVCHQGVQDADIDGSADSVTDPVIAHLQGNGNGRITAKSGSTLAISNATWGKHYFVTTNFGDIRMETGHGAIRKSAPCSAVRSEFHCAGASSDSKNSVGAARSLSSQRTSCR